MKQERQWTPARETEKIDAGLLMEHEEGTAQLYTERTPLQEYDKETSAVILEVETENNSMKKVLTTCGNPHEAENQLEDIEARDLKTWQDIKDRHGEEL